VKLFPPSSVVARARPLTTPDVPIAWPPVSGALIGVAGVIVGLIVGGVSALWETRRQELTGAALAAAVLSDELHRRAHGEKADALLDTWREHRDALVGHMRPGVFRGLAEDIRNVTDTDGSPGVTELKGRLDAATELLWERRERFPLIPLFQWLRGDRLTKRLSDALTRPDRPR
jgi:hypothetical protein